MRDADQLIERILYLDGVPTSRSLTGEEEHANRLETQLGLIPRVGEANDLAQQIRGDAW